ncbi:MAG: D-alanyl-D-alanine carboxypeptidase, partial [Clostridia bacterium]|nr:D-alanyl-D-alanine carboxypeptidase [Clostridia bacterium]
LEEYIDVVRTHDINSPLLIDGGGENKWYVYYVTANEDSKTEVTVPKNSNYKISGDNVQGFIVTADVDIKG